MDQADCTDYSSCGCDLDLFSSLTTSTTPFVLTFSFPSDLLLSTGLVLSEICPQWPQALSWEKIGHSEPSAVTVQPALSFFWGYLPTRTNTYHSTDRRLMSMPAADGRQGSAVGRCLHSPERLWNPQLQSSIISLPWPVSTAHAHSANLISFETSTHQYGIVHTTRHQQHRNWGSSVKHSSAGV